MGWGRKEGRNSYQGKWDILVKLIYEDKIQGISKEQANTSINADAK